MELLSPAGNFQKLKYALMYGADAVYSAGKQFGLRAQAGNFSEQELKKAVEFAHNLGKKVYITLNIYAHNQHLNEMPDYLMFLREIKVDALIISEPGVFSLAKEYVPEIPIHISTQASVTNWKAVEFWSKQGAKRIIMARELGIEEIKEIKRRVPNIELEMFVHGAMCMAYSGRCMLSAYLNKRSANMGLCTQPCRWQYSVIEETRPGQYFQIYEDETGTFIFNSKDLCLFQRLKEIHDAGVDSIKIEGRMKSIYYTANVTRVYRTAIDRINDIDLQLNNYLREELDKVSHRIYSEAFFDGFDSNETQYHHSSAYNRDYQFVGEIINQIDGWIYINILAKFSLNDTIEFIFPNPNEDFSLLVKEILNEENEKIEFTKPNTTVKIQLGKIIPDNGLVRIKTKICSDYEKE